MLSFVTFLSLKRDASIIRLPQKPVRILWMRSEESLKGLLGKKVCSESVYLVVLLNYKHAVLGYDPFFAYHLFSDK